MSFPTDRYDPVDAVRHIARDGDLDAVEITDYKDPEVKKQIRHILNQSHLSVAYGAQPVILGENLNPNSLDEPERRMAQERLLEAMEDAKSFGASGFSFMAGAWCREGKEEALSQLKKTARACAAAAAVWEWRWSWRSLTSTWTRKCSSAPRLWRPGLPLRCAR